MADSGEELEKAGSSSRKRWSSNSRPARRTAKDEVLPVLGSSLSERPAKSTEGRLACIIACARTYMGRQDGSPLVLIVYLNYERRQEWIDGH